MTIDRAMSEAVRAAYGRGEEEESMLPLVRVDGAGTPVGRIRRGDAVIFYDLRGEREVELTQAFVERGFTAFPVHPDLDLRFVTLIEYDAALGVRVAYPPEERLTGTLAEVVAAAGLRQVKVTETEKAIHLSYFLNGKRKEPFAGETLVAPHSPADPFTEPEMRAREVAAELVRALRDPGAALVVGNFPNMDVVGHGQDRAAIRRAIEAVDRALGAALTAARGAGVTAVVTADHGTVESWLYPDGTIDTGHTKSPVPCAVVSPDGTQARLRDGGTLVDVAPTVLACMGLPQPAAMTGRSLLADPPPARGATPRRALLLVVDGWGLAEPGPGNLHGDADTPAMDALLERGATRLAASGTAVGLPDGTVGNSEAGHLHIGAGRVVWSDRQAIDRAIADGSFHENPAFLWAADHAAATGAALHLLGIVSFFSSHGSIEHLFALLETARRRGVAHVFVHGLLGRRGERKESGAHYVGLIEERCAKLGGRLVSLIGRHWALDREKHWDRVERAYRLLVDGLGRRVPGIGRDGTGDFAGETTPPT